MDGEIPVGRRTGRAFDRALDAAASAVAASDRAREFRVDVHLHRWRRRPVEVDAERELLLQRLLVDPRRPGAGHEG